MTSEVQGAARPEGRDLKVFFIIIGFIKIYFINIIIILLYFIFIIVVFF